MLQEILSAASTAAGIYLLSVNKGKKEAKKDFDEQVEEAAKDKASDYIAEQKAEEAAKDPRFRDMYFAPTDEPYDKFYDYTNDPVFFSDEMLEKANSWNDRKCYAMRCRFLYPIYIQSNENRRNGIWIDAREGFAEINAKGVRTFCRDAFSGSIRYYTLAMEIFNPLPSKAPVKKICFSDIDINGVKCQVVNWGGYIHDASATQMYNMNRKWYNDSASGESGSQLSYIPRVYEYNVDLDIPAKSSVYLIVVLPLGVQQVDPIFYRMDDIKSIYDLAANGVFNLESPNGGIDINSVMNDAFNIFGNSYKQYYDMYMSNQDINLLAIQRIWDFIAGCRGIIVNYFQAAPSLRQGTFSSKVYLCGSADSFVQEGNPEGKEPRKDCPAFDLKIIHGAAPNESSNNFSWQNSYYNDLESELPFVSDSVPQTTINELANRVGMDFDYSEFYDFTSKNLG